jgi:hypothetical protein
MRQKECLLSAPSPTLPRKRGRERTARADRVACNSKHCHQACSCFWQCAQTPEISITGAFGAKPAARAADLS